jgi:hypothetical protein
VLLQSALTESPFRLPFHQLHHVARGERYGEQGDRKPLEQGTHGAKVLRCAVMHVILASYPTFVQAAIGDGPLSS